MATDYTNQIFRKELTALEFSSYGAQNTVIFKAFLSSNISDSYTSNWNSEQVFGRNDPLKTFQSIERKISVSWSIPAFSSEDAEQNMNSLEELIRMLYPSYESAEGLTNISAGPVFRVKFGNIIQDAGFSEPNAEFDGLLCTISGFNVEFSNEQGVFLYNNKLLYKLINISCNLDVLHTHALGWASNKGKGRSWRGKGTAFPYGSSDRNLPEQAVGPVATTILDPRSSSDNDIENKVQKMYIERALS